MSEQEPTQQTFPSLKDNEILLQITLPVGCSSGKKFRVSAPDDARIFEIDIPAGVAGGDSVNVIVSKASRTEPSANENAEAANALNSSDKLLQVSSAEQSNLDDAATAVVGVVVSGGAISGPVIYGAVVNASDATDDSRKAASADPSDETSASEKASTPMMERAGNAVRRMSASILSYIPVTSGAEAEAVSPDPAAMLALNLRPRTSSFANSLAESIAVSSSPLASSPMSDPAAFRQRTRTSSDAVNATESGDAAAEVEPRSRSSNIWRYLTGSAGSESTGPDAAAMAAMSLRPRAPSVNPSAESEGDAASYYTADPEASALHQRSRTTSYAVPAPVAAPTPVVVPEYTEVVERESIMESASHVVRRVSASIMSFVPATSTSAGDSANDDRAALAALRLRPRTDSFSDPAMEALADSAPLYTADPEASALHQQRSRTSSTEQVSVSGKASKSENAEVVDRGSILESAGNAVRRMSASILSYVPVTPAPEPVPDSAAMAALSLRPSAPSVNPEPESAGDAASYYTADPEASALHHRSRTVSSEQVSVPASNSEDTEAADKGSIMESAGNVVRRMSAGLLSYVPVTSTSGAEPVADSAAVAALNLRPRTASFAEPAIEAVVADAASAPASQDSSSSSAPTAAP